VVLNQALIATTTLLYFYFFGVYALLYMYVSGFCAGTVNPFSGHFISEHYVMNPKTEQETYSYYGPLNIFSWNVGYHNEHHDFPNVPWTRFHKLRKIAPEYYEPLEKTDSWFMTIFRFVFDKNVSLYSRVKREKGAGTRKSLLPTKLIEETTQDINLSSNEAKARAS